MHTATTPLPSLKQWISVLVIVSACNTVKGAGEDMEDAGEGIQDAAD